MIILDTNVLSELMLRAPNERVLIWLDQQPRSSIWTTRLSSAALTVFLISLRSLPVRGRSSFARLRMFSLNREMAPAFPRSFTRIFSRAILLFASWISPSAASCNL